jgi:hypothetical protein
MSSAAPREPTSRRRCWVTHLWRSPSSTTSTLTKVYVELGEGSSLDENRPRRSHASLQATQSERDHLRGPGLIQAARHAGALILSKRQKGRYVSWLLSSNPGFKVSADRVAPLARGKASFSPPFPALKLCEATVGRMIKATSARRSAGQAA